MYNVKEIYFTFQGEGAYSGRPSVFCRFSGCNLWTGKEVDRKKAEYAADSLERTVILHGDGLNLNLLEEANVVGTPGSGFGSAGEGYFRLSAFNSRENVKQAMRLITSI